MKDDTVYLEVGGHNDEKRLDRWLKISFGRVTQSRIEVMCRKGKIRVNGLQVRPSHRVVRGDKVYIIGGLEERRENKVKTVEDLTTSEKELIKDSVIYEDKHLIAINKPSGIATQGGTGQTIHIDSLIQYFSSSFLGRPKLVHRLDKETSGILLLAKSSKLASLLASSFRNREMKKVYWALVAGRPPKDRGSIDFPLIRLSRGKMGKDFEKVQCISVGSTKLPPNAKAALSEYSVIEHLANRLCWLAISPITGRTHQLRAHLAHINCPIIGDTKYGKNSQDNKGDGWGVKLGDNIENKLHLHARSLSFNHPITKKQMFIEAKLPKHMQKTWEILGLSSKTFTSD